MMIASAPGKLMLAGEYAVLDGAPALLVAVDRRAIARRDADRPRGSSAFLVAVADELVRRGHADRAHAALEIAVDSKAFYDRTTKLGLGSSAAVTVAATALALETTDPEDILPIALAAHANAQGARGARGSGADVATAVYGGAIVYTAGPARERVGSAGTRLGERAEYNVEPRKWPRTVALLPFFTGHSADTASLVDRAAAARERDPAAVDAALAAIADASRAACSACAAPAELATVALIGALALAANAIDRFALATGLDLVPQCVTAARLALARLGGTAKTTGAGGGDVGVAVIPGTADVTLATRMLIEAGCQPLRVSLDETGVDLRPLAS